MTTPVFEVARPIGRVGATQPTDIVELPLSLTTATNRIAIRGAADGMGRAEAVIGKANWSAKHYWTEGEGQQQVTVYEFDEALPSGEVLLRIPMLASE